MKRKLSLSGIIMVLLIVVFNVWQAATAGAAPEEIVHFAKGASTDKSVPAPQDIGNNKVAVFVPTTPDPMDMEKGINQQVEELNQSVSPGSDGVRRAGGFSAGSVAAVRWAQQTDPKDGPVELTLQGSPNGEGSIAELIFDTPIIKPNPTDLPDHVSGTVFNVRNDGYASCKNQLSSIIECPAGILVGHYCVGAEQVPGQCYANFVGPVTVSKDGNMTYYTGETRNPVATLIEAGGKMIDPNFKVEPGQEAAIEAALPQGTPGVASTTPTPRDVIQPVIDLMGGKMPSLPELGEQLLSGARTDAIGEAPQADPIPAAGPMFDQKWADEGIQTLETFVNSPSPETFVSTVTQIASNAMGQQSAPSNDSTPAPAPIAPVMPDLGALVNAGAQIFAPLMGGA